MNTGIVRHLCTVILKTSILREVIMLSLLNVLFDSKKYKVNEKIRYLETCNHLGTFGGELGQAEETEIAEKKIKALLSIPGLRTDGLLLLHTLLPQCSTKVFLDNCESWTQYLLKILKGNDRVADKRLALRIFCSLIPYAKPFPQLWKKLAVSLVPTLLESILKLTLEDEWVHDAIEVLSICMIHFPGPCGQFKHRIETFFVKHLDSWNGKKTCENIATCVAYLSMCGGGGSQGVNHSAAWKDQATRIVTCLNQLLDFIYEGIAISDDSPAIIFSSVELPPLQSCDPIRAIFQAWHRYELLSLCLIKMLSCQFPVTVNVPVGDILSFVCKVFSKNSRTMATKASLERAAVASVIPVLHSIAFNILEALMVSCQKRLLIHAGMINKLFVNTLKWTKVDESYHGTSKPYGKLRISAYQAMLLWLQLMGSTCNLAKHEDVLVQQLLSDIAPETDSVQLQARSRVTARLGKQKTKMKDRQSALSDFAQDECSFRKINLCSCQEMCQEALGVLKYFLYTFGGILSADILKQIHEAVVRQLLHIQLGKSASSSLYSSLECKRELYAVLLACVLRHNPRRPPPLPCAIQIFVGGQADVDVQISSFCNEALAICNTIIHPRVSILDYTIHSVSQPGSPLAVSEAESPIGILEEASHSREAQNTGRSIALNVKDQIETTRFKPLQPKRQPKQTDIVMLSENESEHYSEEDKEDVMDALSQQQVDHDEEPVDYVLPPSRVLNESRVVKAKMETNLLQQALMQQNHNSETNREGIVIRDGTAQKPFIDNYEEECDVSEDDAELIETEEDEDGEEGEYEDEEEEEEEAGEGEYDEEGMEHDYLEEEEGMEHDYLEEEEVDDYKPRSESCDSNVIQVTSTTTKYCKADVSKHEGENSEVATSILVDLSESPEKGKEKDLQTGGGPHSDAFIAEETSVENFSSTLQVMPECEFEIRSSYSLLQGLPTENHVQEIQECFQIGDGIKDPVISEVLVPAVEMQDDDVHLLLESVVSAVSKYESKPFATVSVVPESVVDMNGCDTTYNLQEEPPLNSNMTTENENCIVLNMSPSNEVTESCVVGSAEESNSTSDYKSDGIKHSLPYDDTEEEQVSKKHKTSRLSETVSEPHPVGDHMTLFISNFKDSN